MTALLPAVQEPRTEVAPGSPYDVDIDRLRFWVGAALTATIAALTALVGLTLLNGVLGLALGQGTIDPAAYALAAVAAALAAATLFYAMLHVAPRPGVYYGWLAVISTLLAVTLPFAGSAALASEVGLAGLNLAVGLVIATLVPIAAVQARR
ncbi:MAG: DUF6069 family protein [Nocardioides sp.]